MWVCMLLYCVGLFNWKLIVTESLLLPEKKYHEANYLLLQIIGPENTVEKAYFRQYN